MRRDGHRETLRKRSAAVARDWVPGRVPVVKRSTHLPNEPLCVLSCGRAGCPVDRSRSRAGRLRLQSGSAGPGGVTAQPRAQARSTPAQEEAAGAACLTPGAADCRRADVQRLLPSIQLLPYP
jgi:hypothetical protein